MKRLAVFAEGQTEVMFVEKLIEEIAGRNKVQIRHVSIRGGSSAPRTLTTIKASKQTGQEYYVLLVDCGGDHQVKTRILENHSQFTKMGYWKLIGIRDVRPTFAYAEIQRLEVGLTYGVKTSWAPVDFILSIMEIEAWFLAEATHFPRIDPSINAAAIRTQLGFDPETDDMGLRACPAADLNACYALAGQHYHKSRAKRTVDALDYARIYLALRSKISYLDRLVHDLEGFLDS